MGAGRLPSHSCRSPRQGANSIPNFKEIENWENDIIFCNPILWIAKNDIVFAYQFVPFNSSNWGRGELQLCNAKMASFALARSRQ
jgi:hypothetical protein